MLAMIEDAMIERLKGTLTYLRSVESYGGQFDDDTFDVVRVLPAIWIAFAGTGKPEQKGADRFLTPASFVVMHCARSVRGEKATRHGGPNGEVGVYQLLRDVKQILLMQDLGLAIDHLRPGPIKTLFNTKLRKNGLAVFTQEWTTKFIDNVAGLPMIGGAPVAKVVIGGKQVTTPIVDGVPVTTPPGDLLRINADYTLKPGDDVVDASDLVKLQP